MKSIGLSGGLLAAVIAAGACSSGEEPSSATSKSSEGLSIFPAKIYSGFDGTNTFKAPVIAVGAKNVKWSVDDASLVKLEPSADGTQLMITAKKAGKAKLTATSGSTKKTATITVNAYTAAQRKAGEKRYTTEGSGAGGKACKGCHGAGKNAPDHTPTEIDADTDEEVINTVLTGKDPEGRPIDAPNHQWTVTDDERTGLMAYLRALEPHGFPSKDEATANKNGEGE
jgi:mono/diheme cytochrome c family protein